MEIEQEAPDGSRRTVAVIDEVRPVGIAMLHRILLERRDQVEAMPEWYAGDHKHVAHGMRFGKPGVITMLTTKERSFKAIQPGYLVFRGEIRAVGDIVDRPSVSIENGDVRLHSGRQQKRAHRKVFVSRILPRRRLDDARLRDNGHFRASSEGRSRASGFLPNPPAHFVEQRRE